MTRVEFQQFVGVSYNFNNGPSSINGNEDLTDGLNCQALVHRIYKEFGINLPDDLLSKEVFEERELFLDLPTSSVGVQDLTVLDMLVFGKQDVQDLRRLHLGLFIGEVDEMQNPLIIHATRIDNKVSIWPLPKFFTYPKYVILYAIKRLRIS